MVAKAADTSSILQIPVVMHTPQFGNPCFKSKSLVCNVSAFSQFNLSTSISVSQMWRFGAVKYYHSRILLFMKLRYNKHVKQTKWESLPSSLKCVPKEKGSQEKRQLQSWPFHASQQDAGNNSSRALQKEAVAAAAAWGWARGGRNSGRGGQSSPRDWCSSPAPLHVQISPAQ